MDMELNGFIVLYRKLIQWGWYKDHTVKDLFIHLLLTASYKEFDFRGNKYPAGTLISDRKKLSEDLGFSEQQIRTAIKKLESTGEICVKSTNRFSAITVVKWGDYQLCKFIDNQQITNKQPTDNQQITNRGTDTYYIKNKETNKQSNKYIINARTRARKEKNDFGAFDLDAFEDKLRGE